MPHVPTSLVWRHIPFEGPGVLGRILRLRGWNVRIVDISEPRHVSADADGADLLMVMGGPMGAYETERYPFLENEIACCRKRLADDRPVLGVCLGAQILAASLEAGVYPGPTKEIGWYPVEPASWVFEDEEAFGLFHRTRTMLHWHGDTFDLPKGADSIARSERYEHQGFRYGRNGYALQFHLEIPDGEIGFWTAGHAADLHQSHPGVQSAADIEAGAQRHGIDMACNASVFFHAWLSRLEREMGL